MHVVGSTEVLVTTVCVKTRYLMEMRYVYVCIYPLVPGVALYLVSCTWDMDILLHLLLSCTACYVRFSLLGSAWPSLAYRYPIPVSLPLSWHATAVHICDVIILCIV